MINKLLSNIVNNIYFCRDGKIRAHVSDKVKQPEQDVVDIMQIKDHLLLSEVEKSTFFYTLLQKQIIFEKGITFGEIIKCLYEWEKEISLIVGVNAKSFFDSINIPKDNMPTHRKKINAETHYIQFVRRSVIYEKTSRNRKAVRHEDGTFSLEEIEVESKENKKSEKIVKSREGLFFDVVAKEKTENLPEYLLWSSFNDDFSGLQDMTFVFTSDEYIFANQETRKKLGISTKTPFEKKDLYFDALRFQDSYNSITMFEFITEMFACFPDEYTPVSPTSIAINEHFGTSDELDKNKFTETKNIYIRAALIEKRFMSERQDGIKSLKFEKINGFIFSENNDVDQIVLYNDIFKIEK